MTIDDGFSCLSSINGFLFAQQVPVGAIPLDGAAQALFQRRLGAPTEPPLCPAGVQAASGLAAGLVGIPDDLTLEARQVGDEVHQVFDGDLEPGSAGDSDAFR